MAEVEKLAEDKVFLAMTRPSVFMGLPLEAIKGGAAPKQLTGLASADLVDQISRADVVTERAEQFLGLKRS